MTRSTDWSIERFRVERRRKGYHVFARGFPNHAETYNPTRKHMTVKGTDWSIERENTSSQWRLKKVDNNGIRNKCYHTVHFRYDPTRTYVTMELWNYTGTAWWTFRDD